MRVKFTQSIDADASDEHWYLLEFNEDSGEWSITHDWDIVKIGRGMNDNGTKSYTLIEAKEAIPDVYAKAVELLRVRVFDKPPDLRGIRSIVNTRYE